MSIALSDLSEVFNTIFTVGTPTVTVIVIFSKVRADVARLIHEVEKIQQVVTLVPMFELRASNLENRVDKIESLVIDFAARMSASEQDRKGLHPLNKIVRVFTKL